ncbi:MAG: glycosyltransferase family 4 protein [Fastidiosipilaceae bacterium]|jgi:glycosyltransferase involved in cell wall biosynthesis
MDILVISLPDLKKINPQRPHHILRHLIKNHEVSVISANAWWLNEIEDSLTVDMFQDVQYSYLSDKKINPIIQELLINKTLDSMTKEGQNFDVCVNFHSIVAGRILSRHPDLPIVFDICDDIIDWIANSPQIPPLFGPLAGSAAGFLLQKNVKSSSTITYSIESLKKKYNLPDTKSHMIPNGVDTGMFYDKGTHVRKQLGLLDEDTVLGFVGFLGPWVDLDPVFEAIVELKRHNDISMVIVGDGPRLGHFMNRAKELSIAENVIFTGNIQYLDVPDYISSMDICLLPFDTGMVSQNALPLKLFEYMACGVPVISTPISGVQHAVGDRIHYFSNSGDLQECITRIMRDETLYSVAASEGRQYVEQHFSWNAILSEFENILFEAVRDERA